MKVVSNELGDLFLVLTACEEFWDPAKRLVFLGEQTRRFSRRAFWTSLNGCLLADPWPTPETVAVASQYISALTETWLLVIAKNLKSIHASDYSVRYWRILIGNWLLWQLGALFERYSRLAEAMKLFPTATTITLHPDSFVIPRDTMDFVQLLKGDIYNQQLYTQILNYWGRTYLKKRVTFEAEGFSRAQHPSGRLSMISRVKNVSDRLLRWSSAPKMVTKGVHGPRWFQAALYLRSGRRVWPTFVPARRGRSYPVDEVARSKVASSLSPQNDFERFAAKFLENNIPQYLIEGYGELVKVSEREYPKPPRVIMSANSWYYDEPFKQWAALCAENGTRLLGSQHGGNYGCLADNSSERHELSICDRYFTWGWEVRGAETKVVPSYALKFAGKRKASSSEHTVGVLFVATQTLRYPMHLTPTAVKFTEYLDWQRRFNLALPEHFRKLVRVRFHIEDLGWDIAARWRVWNPDATLDSWDVPFDESLRKRRFYVCDHLSTTFIQALVADKPTILFWDPAINVLRDEAKPYYEALHRAGILYYDPESASRAMTAAYAEAQVWWAEPGRRVARANFCNRFAKTGRDELGHWWGLLRQELNATS